MSVDGEETRVGEIAGGEPKYDNAKPIPILLDATDDDWAWRRAIRANPVTSKLYRAAVFLVGLVLVVVGLVLVPLPGPGWLVVFLGVAIWASEFERAQQLKDWGVGKVQRWNAWVKKQPLALQAVFAALTVVFVLAIVYAVLRISGVPTFFPDALERLLHDRANL